MFRNSKGILIPINQIPQKVKIRIKTIILELVSGLLWWVVGNIPFHSLRKLFYRLTGMKIGTGSTIHMQARIYDPTGITIGKDTVIGEKSTLDGRKQLPNSKGGLVIGDHVDIASEVMIWTSEHNIESPDWQAIEEKVVIENYVFIGPRAIILPGVRIGYGAIVGAGAIVTKNVQANSIVAGIPAKLIGIRKMKKHHYQLGRARLFQ